MARPGITLGSMLRTAMISENKKTVRVRFEQAVEDSPFKEYFLECLEKAEQGCTWFAKTGKFAKCQEMKDVFNDEGINLSFFGDCMKFSWSAPAVEP